MCRLIKIGIFITTLICTGFVAGQNHADTSIWKEFVIKLKENEFPRDKIRAHHESLTDAMAGFLKLMREKANWDEWNAKPEVHKVDNKIHYVIPLTFDGEQATYCFTFLIEGTNWYFQHLEAITIRLDKLGPLPTSVFPDLSKDYKNWMREEIRISQQVRLHNLLVKEKGKCFALDWLKDGKGYFLAAKTWVPFFTAHKAFVLYMCWEQSNLKGHDVELLQLDEKIAEVKVHPIYYDLYKNAAHLKQQISFEDYRKIYEIIWQDRATKAGWKLDLIYKEEFILFTFKKHN
ncbi:hypothetical protein KAR48_16115 [bacterium]|nr:hypothetical protein [bacterium]